MTIMYDNEVMVSSQGMYNNKKSNFATQDIYYGPTNKKNDPCSTCLKAETCGYECKAFTSWADTGDCSLVVLARKINKGEFLHGEPGDE